MSDRILYPWLIKFGLSIFLAISSAFMATSIASGLPWLFRATANLRFVIIMPVFSSSMLKFSSAICKAFSACAYLPIFISIPPMLYSELAMDLSIFRPVRIFKACLWYIKEESSAPNASYDLPMQVKVFEIPFWSSIVFFMESVSLK